VKSGISSEGWKLEAAGLAWFLVAGALVATGCASSPKYRSTEVAQPGQGARTGFYAKGYASYYGREFHGKKTASGEVYNMYAMTAAHRTLPFGTVVEVENLDNGKKVVVRINDRGPFIPGRILDLSRAAARKLGMIGDGTALVRLRILKWGR